MYYKSLFIIVSLLGVVACGQFKSQEPVAVLSQPENMETEKQAILRTLNGETKAAFQRNYNAWQSKWIHSPTMTKVYEDLAGGESSTSTGWNEISQFVKDFFVAHPEPEPVPELLSEIDVRIDGTRAEVIYEQQDALRGRKVETRTMQKVDGEWKIAGMKTTIHGFDQPN